MDKTDKAGDAHMRAAWPIILLLGIVVSLPTGLGAQETHDTTLTMGKPEDVGMSGPVLSAAVSLYSEAAARGDIVGAVLLVARHGQVVMYEAVGLRDREKNLSMEGPSTRGQPLREI